jgi:putative endonuclease
MNKQYWVYILLCDNGSYYTGYTTDLKRRFQEHLLGTEKCKYTRSFKPIKIAQSWQVNDASTAKRLENYIKKLNKIEKERLVLSPGLLPIEKYTIS